MSSSVASSFAKVAASAALIMHCGAVAAHAQVCAYLARGNTVTVVNAETTAVVANIPVAARDIALTADGRFAYVLDSDYARGNDISIIDTRKRRVTATVPDAPFRNGDSIAVSADGGIAYVATLPPDRTRYPRYRQFRTVEIIDTATGSLKRTIHNAGGDLVLSPDGAFLYASAGNAFGFNAIPPASVINTRRRYVVSEIAGVGGGSIAISPDARFAYLTGPALRVLDTATNTITSEIADAGGNDVAVSPDGRFAYVVQDSAVVVVDLATNTVVDTISTNFGLWRIAINPDGRSAYIANRVERTLLELDLTTSTITAEHAALSASSIVFAFVPDGCTLPLPGDCNADGVVTISELTAGVKMLLDGEPTDACAAFDRDGNQRVTVDELLVPVDEALHPPGFEGPVRFGANGEAR